jgi:hypothetical protein
MEHVFMKVFVFCEVIGILITCFALLNLIRISKKHKKLTDEEYLSKENRLARNKYLIMGILGMTISSLMQIIIIFTR